ncbi:MAG: ornithine cyclodeaminase family protein, partial [Myxococcales bacterium]
AVARSDVCVTCTPSRKPLLHELRPGIFVAAVGADSPDKQELDPALLASAKVVVDSLDQCAEIGELHHAIEAGSMRREDVHAEIGEIVAGRKRGRTDDEEITVFDSTGTALQDVAAAASVYAAATRLRRGIELEL